MRRDPNLIPLSQQHHNALALCVLTERALSSTPDLASLAKRVVDRFDLEMANHFQLEEEILFPAVAALPELAPLVSELIADHRRFEGMVAIFRLGPTTPEGLLEFTTQLRGHVRKEENVLFERAQTLLPEDVLTRMGEAFARRAVRICLE